MLFRSLWYQFENSSSTYGWNFALDLFGGDFEDLSAFDQLLDEKRKRYEITDENAQQPKAEVGCKGINDVNYKDMFLGISESISFSELEETYGIQGTGTYVVADYERKKGWEAYLQTFNYNSMTVYIYTKAIGKIDSETYVAFFYR